MNKKNLPAYAAIALAFGAMGAAAGLYKQDASPPAAAVAAKVPAEVPAGAATRTDAGAQATVTALFAQTMNDSKGVSQPLSQWRGKVLLLNFWAPWCPPCVQEMPELDRLAAAQRGKNVQVVGIGIDAPANIASFAATLKISYPLLVAGLQGTELSRQFGNSAGGLPYTVLIGADGQVKKTYLGRLKFEQVKADLAAL